MCADCDRSVATCSWCGGDTSVSQHSSDNIVVHSLTPNAVVALEHVAAIAKWLVMGKADKVKKGGRGGGPHAAKEGGPTGPANADVRDRYIGCT